MYIIKLLLCFILWKHTKNTRETSIWRRRALAVLTTNSRPLLKTDLTEPNTGKKEKKALACIETSWIDFSSMLNVENIANTQRREWLWNEFQLSANSYLLYGRGWAEISSSGLRSREIEGQCVYVMLCEWKYEAW